MAITIYYLVVTLKRHTGSIEIIGSSIKYEFYNRIFN